MKFEETFDFDHDAETVLRMFCDPDYYVDKYEKLGGPAPEFVETQTDESGVRISVRHALEAERLGFPDFVRKRMGDRVMLLQTDAWQRAESAGRTVISIEKAPVQIQIDMRLHDRADKACRLALAFEIDAEIMLIGSKIEKAIAGPITKRMHRDLEVSNELASRYRA